MQIPWVAKNNQLSAPMKSFLTLSILIAAILVSFGAFYWYRTFATPFVVVGWAILYQRKALYVFVVGLLALLALGFLEFVNQIGNIDNGENTIRNSWGTLFIMVAIALVLIILIIQSATKDSKSIPKK